MLLDEDDIRNILTNFQERSKLIQRAGGIAARDVVDGRSTIPTGWILDAQMDFYIPPNFEEIMSARLA